MRYWILIASITFLSLNSFSAISNREEINQIKQAMFRAVESKSVTDSLYSMLKAKKSPIPLMVGYMGTLEALKAKHSWNPYSKLKYVALANKTLKEAVKRDKDNLEIRFMRFSVQHYTPAFLGYSKELEEDQKIIIEQYQQKKFGYAEQLLVKSIARFMIESKRCSPAEIKLLKKYA